MKRSFFLKWMLVLWAVASSAAMAELRVSGIFSDHMVLQRDRLGPVWGWADAGATVNVQFGDQDVSSVADESGGWGVHLASMLARGEGRTLLIKTGNEQIQILDVLVGEVWHASGQSNMAMNVGAVAKRLTLAQRHVAEANHPTIRFRRINEGESAKPQKDLPRKEAWKVCTPETVSGFSAAAFYFARMLQEELHVPIGIIDSSRGGTPIEPFIPREAFTTHPTLIRELELGDLGDLPGLTKLPGGVRARDANWLPGRLFHSRLAPIASFAVRGTVWYQAESNCGVGEDPRDYQHKMRALIQGWREAFKNPDMPVYFVQLPGSGAGNGWPYMREQQRLILNHSSQVGMAVTIDLLDDGIHPPNKIDVGRRLARWALANTYKKERPFSGPLFKQAKVDGDRVTVHFEHVESGLMIAIKEGLEDPIESSKTSLSHFELADASGQWHLANAVIEGKVLVVRSEEVNDPIAVRYGYAVNPQHCHLYNRDGLPASPFCSDPKLLTYESDL